MPKIKQTVPQPDRHKNERNTDPLFLTRPYYNWNAPAWVDAKYWRLAVQQQEICMTCRETLISNNLSLDWKVEPRDSSQQDELKEEVKYYEKFITYTGDYHYSEIVEWGGADYLDLPFGFAAELGRVGDEKEGRVLWLELLDGATLFPTLNSDWPVGQYVPEGGQKPIYFPKHAINRIYMSPRSELRRKGWGMAPPEKIFMALNMISRGDLYYANLLLDTPEAGILDLIDMSKDSAEAWVDAWRKMLAGIDPYKIPILYEHTQQAQWIPFTRPPQELMFTEALSHYISVVTSGYGMTPSDIGISTSSRTLAGTIRDDRKTKNNGQARFKLKLTEFWNSLLPSTLRFKYIDLDDEVSVAKGRARLANGTAFVAKINAGIISPGEARRQLIADGLMDISMPEEVPQEVKDAQEQKLNGFNAERPSMLGRPVSPSQGGWGETAARSQFKSWLDGVRDVQDVYLQRLVFLAFPGVLAQLKGVISGLDDENLIYDWIINQNEALLFNDGEIYHPDQMDLSLVELLKSNVTSVGMIKTIYESQIQEDVSKLYFDVVKKVSDDWLNRNFIQEGELQHTDHDTLVSISDNVFKEIVSFTKGVDAVLPEIMAKSIVIGLRDYLVETKQQDQLEASYDPMCLAYVRSALGSALDGLFDGYKDRISGIIVKELEKSLNG